MAEYRSQEGLEPNSFAEIIELLNAMRKQTSAKTQNYVSNLDNILSAGQASQSQEQITNAQQALSNNSPYSDTTRIAFNTAKTALDNKQFEINKYESSIQQGADIINSPLFLDKQEEWMNLEDLRKSKTNKDGTYVYESVGSMLSDEYVAIESLYNNISKKQLRYNKDATFDDQEVIQKIGQYKNRLDKAIIANLGDNIITPDEAQLIISGVNKVEFKAFVGNKKTELKDLIGNQQSLVKSINGNIAGSLENEELLGLLEKFIPNMSEEDKLTMVSGSPKALDDMLELEQGKLTKLYEQYQYWSGGGYGQKAPQLDSTEFGDVANEGEEVITVDNILGITPLNVSEFSDVALTEEEMGEDVLVEKEKVKKDIPTAEDVMLKGTEEQKTQPEIREAEYYSFVPQPDFNIPISFTGNVRDKKSFKKVDNIYNNIKETGLKKIEENIIMLYENFSKRGKLYKEGVSPEYDKRNKLNQEQYILRAFKKHEKTLAQIQQIFNKIESSPKGSIKIDNLKAKLVKKYNQLMKNVESDTKSDFMKND